MIQSILLLASTLAAKPVDLLEKGVQPGSYGYGYGGKTKGEIVKGARPELRYQGDDREWSGWTIHLPSNLDWTSIRKSGGLEFEIKGRKGGEKVTLGLLDDESDGPGRRVQVRARLSDYGAFGRDWKKICIAFSDFEDMGAWWDDKSKQEVVGKFDWDKVSEIRISSDKGGNPGLTDSLDLIEVEFRDFRVVDSSTVAKAAEKTNPDIPGVDAPVLRWNHAGYAAGGPKRFVAANPTEPKFSLRDAADKVVFEGALGAATSWDASGEKASVGDFTAFATPGTYSLVVGKIRSRPFAIGPSPWAPILHDAVKAFYYQRASTELLPKHAGVFARPYAHPDTGLELLEAGRDGKWSATGGWYDAGDYGKYVVNGAFSVGVLLQAYEMAPQLFTDATGIPESGNGRADLLDETIWELDWMARMQDTDGGLFFKLASTRWDGMEMPKRTQTRRFVIGKSTTASLDFAASAALASRLLSKSDKKLAASYLDRAEKAYAFARKNPALREPKETGGSGGYEDSDPADEFLWAASELWLATGKPEYRQDTKKALDSIPTMTAPSWQRVQNLAVYELALAGTDSLGATCRRRIDSVATLIRGQISANPYRVPVDGFSWGSNDPVLAKSVPLVLAQRFDPKAPSEGLVDILDYVLGRNATGLSFVTGTGEGSAMHPHHRIMTADTVVAPMPGFVVGGPNWARQDSKSKVSWGVEYPYKEPARSHLDLSASYASNEIAVNWNAALVVALAAAESTRK